MTSSEVHVLFIADGWIALLETCEPTMIILILAGEVVELAMVV